MSVFRYRKQRWHWKLVSKSNNCSQNMLF